MNETVKMVIENLNKSSDKKIYERAKKNYPTKMTLIGAKSTAIREQMEKVLEIYKNATSEELLQLADEFINTEIIECQLLAYELLSKHQNINSLLNEKMVIRLAKNLDNWVSVDTFGTSVSGIAWKNNLLSDSLIEQWANSEDRWYRRLALVSSIPLNQNPRNKKGRPENILRFVDMLKTDRDDIVIKAISWILRVLTKVDKKAIENYLIENEDVLAMRIKREVRNKLVNGVKY